MNWLKRNLYLVLGAVAALVLLGLAGFYLYQQKQKERQVTGALEGQITEWKRLTNRKPSANEENIEAAKKEQSRLSELLRTNREYLCADGHVHEHGQRDLQDAVGDDHLRSGTTRIAAWGFVAAAV
jgi:uncharacterized protein HemX